MVFLNHVHVLCLPQLHYLYVITSHMRHPVESISTSGGGRDHSYCLYFFGTSVRIDNQNCINSYEKNIFGESEKKIDFCMTLLQYAVFFFVFLLKSIQFLRRVTTLHTQNEIIKKPKVFFSANSF